MENFFKWLAVPIPKDELETYFNMNNINREKIDLFLDILMSLNATITKTYLGDSEDNSLSVAYTDEDKEKHFNWCWVKTIDSFKKENIVLNNEGSHKTYLKNFYNRTCVLFLAANKYFILAIPNTNNNLSSVRVQPIVK